MWIDAHQHFWSYSQAGYPWIRSEPLARDYLPGELEPQVLAAGFQGTVLVQAQSRFEENVWLLGLLEAHPFIKGVVGWVDLERAGAQVQLEELAAQPGFCGVRYPMGVVDVRGRQFSPAFLKGLQAVSDLGLVYELLLSPPQLPLATALVRKFPKQRFVLDHIGNPDVRGSKLEPWAPDLRELAAQPNVYCKLSGMVTRADHAHWTPDDFRPFLDVVFEAFGPERLMIGSDWPVCRQAGEYGPVMEIVKGYLASSPSRVREAILGENAARIYNLPVQRSRT